MKLYKEIGMPPLPNKEEKQNGDIEPKQPTLNIDTKTNKTLTKTNSDLEYDKYLGLFRRNRPKTPAVQARNVSLKPRLAVSEKRESLQEIKPPTKLLSTFNIGSLKQFKTQNSGSIHDYDFMNKIGQGAYAVVKLATYTPTGEKRAVKMYDRSKLIDGTRKQSLMKEIKILKKIDHPNIIKFYEAIDTAKYVYLCTEFVSGPSLLQLLKSKPDR